ncbi:TPA: DUF1749 domain-containing protein [Candidatus Spyradomonas excrementavium]|nr:DUF1749 domain-containing protein [Candidatus Spyradomonas excrementavium]
MEIIRVKTPRGLELKGAMWGSDRMNTVVIMMSGICSNVFQNDLLTSTGGLLNKNNIAFIAGHAMDAFSCIAYSDFSTGKQKYTGVVYDDFNLVYEDVEAYVKFARDLGFKNIILAGHSLGSNKIIHYLGNTSDNFVDYFIVSAPVDLAHWFEVMPNVKECIELAKKFVDENRGTEILPYLFGGFSPMSAETVLSFYNAFNLKNCPVISNNGETASLFNIKVNGSFVIGEKDSLTDGNPEGFMVKLNSYCKHPERNQVIVIPDASHIFYGKDKEYAQTILECVEKHSFLKSTL